MTPMPQTTPSAPDRARVVIAMDVDGVLNVSPDEGTVTHDLHMPAGTLPKSPFLRGGGLTDLTGKVHLRPEYGRWLNRLRERADLVWATTWEHAANTHLAPLLGIDPIPVGISTDRQHPRFGYVKNGDSAAWKAEALDEAFPGQPLIWVDDSAWREVVGADVHARPWRESPYLVIAPDEKVGLTAEHMAQIEAFVDNPATPTVERPQWWDDELDGPWESRFHNALLDEDDEENDEDTADRD